MSANFQPVAFKVRGKTIAALQQSNTAGSRLPILYLHGWLDNANSFVPMMPLVEGSEQVAIDLPGHGHSSHLDGGYSVGEMVYWVIATANELGWDKFHLVGHSLGGSIAPLVAVAAKDRIASVTMIEASGALTEPADKYPHRLIKALDDRLNAARVTSRQFASVDDAINARLKAAKMKPQCARLIVERQLSKHASGHHEWRFDPLLRMASPFYLTEEHVLAANRHVDCPVLAILSDAGFIANRAGSDERLGAFTQWQSLTLPGFHHVHMDTPEPVAQALNGFLQNVNAVG